MADSLFLERRGTYRLLAQDGLPIRLAERSELLGLSEERPGRRGADLRYRSGAREIVAGLRGASEALRVAAEPLLADPTPIEGELEWAREVCRELAAAATTRGIPGPRVLFYRSWQDVLFADQAGARSDRRAMFVIELSGTLRADGAKAWECWRALSYPDREALARARPQMDGTLEEIARVLREGAPGAPCPSGRFPVVFPPGAASGSFFHEVCGHPLEGDVVARGGSYLARRQGEGIAAEFVTISDDPSRGDGCTYAFDDQGSAAARVPLIEAGRVAEPMLDLAFAAHLGHPSNGHGRRVDFRHPALPRMAHTQVEPHQGTLAEFVDSVGNGLLVQHLTPRHVDLLSGEFSFFINEARRIEHGQLKQLIGPAILRGRGDEALGSITAVGDDYRPLYATRGCRKLDHGPLHVSFGQPAIRFSGLDVEPWY